MLMLTRHAEQMALIVVQHFTIGAGPQQAITMAAISRLYDDASSHDRIKPFRLLDHPGLSRPVLRLCQRF